MKSLQKFPVVIIVIINMYNLLLKVIIKGVLVVLLTVSDIPGGGGLETGLGRGEGAFV